MDVESRGTSWLSQLTVEYGVNSSMEIAQVEAYLMMMFLTTTTMIMTEATRWTPTSPPSTSPPPLSPLLALATSRVTQGSKGFSPSSSCLLEVPSPLERFTGCIEPLSLDACHNLWQCCIDSGTDVWPESRIRQEGGEVSARPDIIFFCRSSTWNTLPGFTNCRRMCAKG